jgi:uncharacterized protein YjgD (DUF1641 family)
MAKQLSNIEKRVMSQAEQDAQSLGQIMGAVTEQKEALMVFLDVIGELHEAGVLETLRGMLKARTKIGVIALSQMNKSGAQHLVRNAFSAVQFLAAMDPARLRVMLDSVTRGMEKAEPADHRIGVMGLMGTLRDPEVNAALSTMINFLRGMGQGLGQGAQHVH